MITTIRFIDLLGDTTAHIQGLAANPKHAGRQAAHAAREPGSRSIRYHWIAGRTNKGCHGIQARLCHWPLPTQSLLRIRGPARCSRGRGERELPPHGSWQPLRATTGQTPALQLRNCWPSCAGRAAAARAAGAARAGRQAAAGPTGRADAAAHVGAAQRARRSRRSRRRPALDAWRRQPAAQLES